MNERPPVMEPMSEEDRRKLLAAQAAAANGWPSGWSMKRRRDYFLGAPLAERKPFRRDPSPFEPAAPTDACDRCGHVLRPGDWPWCRGDAADHRNPHYGFTWGAGGPFTQRRT